MTTSTHVYTAALIGAPDVPLSVKGGRLTLDEGRAPHVQGTLDIALPTESTLTALDPRAGARVRVVANATYPTFSTTRTFNMGLRSRPIQHRDATVTLALASDEALLDDYATLADDATPFTLSASLRAVINYVLGEVIPGASLTATPAGDANVTPYWAVTNLLRNPAVLTTVGNWAGGGGCTIAWSADTGTVGTVRATTTGTGGAVFAVNTTAYDIPATPGTRYTFSVEGRNEGIVAPAERMFATLRFLDSNNVVIANTSSPVGIAPTGAYQRVSVTAVAPANAAKIAPYWTFTSSTSGRVFRLTRGMLYQDDGFPVAPFSGSTAADANYGYAYQGTAGDSPSVRTPVVERDPSSLVWRAGQSALDFLLPLFQAAGYRLVCDESRAWTLRDADYYAAGSLTIRHGVNLVDGSETIDRDSRLWFDGQVTRYTWTDKNGVQQERTDAYALTGTPTLVNLVELAVPYPGPGRSQYAVTRAQGRGREVTVTAVADWRAAAEQPITVFLYGAPRQDGKTSQVEFNLDADEMTITTRTTDVLAGSIDTLAGVINSLVGMINGL